MSLLTLDRRPYHIDTNQWTALNMISISVMKELIHSLSSPLDPGNFVILSYKAWLSCFNTGLIL